MRSLPNRFQPKFTAIEESKNIDLLKVEELVGNLQASSFRSLKKSKGIALTSTKENENETNEEQEEDLEIIFENLF